MNEVRIEKSVSNKVEELREVIFIITIHDINTTKTI